MGLEEEKIKNYYICDFSFIVKSEPYVNGIIFIQISKLMKISEGRKQYTYDKRTIYQWDQSLDSINLFVQAPPLPPNIKLSSAFDIKIKSNSITIGIKGNPPYLSHQTLGIVDSEESVWYISENPTKKQIKQIVIDLQKAQKGVRWGGVFKGHTNLNQFEEEQLKKKMMIERFQEEHPGFDFSGAEFNGQVPEARTFMGGVKYD